MFKCDNKSHCHDPITIGEDINGLRVHCKQCHTTEVIRKMPWGTPHKAQYAAFFKRDILQGNDNLFYKYYPQHLRV